MYRCMCLCVIHTHTTALNVVAATSVGSSSCKRGFNVLASEVS